jgi:hypothetical protein
MVFSVMATFAKQIDFLSQKKKTFSPNVKKKKERGKVAETQVAEFRNLLTVILRSF